MTMKKLFSMMSLLLCDGLLLFNSVRLTAEPLPTVHLHPQVRELPTENQTVIRSDTLAPFIKHITLITADEKNHAPVITGFNQTQPIPRIGTTLRVLADFKSNPPPAANTPFLIVHLTQPIKKGKTTEAYGGIIVGEAQWDSTAFQITQLNREILVGDQLFTLKPESAPPSEWRLTPPKKPVQSEIVSALGDYQTIGSHQVVALSGGTAEGLAPGTLLQIIKPESRATVGQLMVLQTFSSLSLGWILDSREPLQLHDLLQGP